LLEEISTTVHSSDFDITDVKDKLDRINEIINGLNE